MIGEISYTPRNGAPPEMGCKRNPEVSSEMSRINEALDILDKCMADHLQRIEPILRQEPATPETAIRGGASEEHRTSALGGALQQLRYKIERITEIVNLSTRRVEL